MRKLTNKWFSLVELLVVITILSIISVVAYQNFGGATDKAIASRKKTDISTIETALLQFKTDKKYYPMPQEKSSSNLWWYTWAVVANPSNTIKVTYDWQEISTIVDADTNWGWRIIYSTGSTHYQIWAKWVIWYNWEFGKNFLSKELFDPELWDVDVKSTSKTMIDYGIWKYVYWIYALPKQVAWSPTGVTSWNISKASWSYYNIATTIKKADSELYQSYVVWDYDENSCTLNTVVCPKTLISNWSVTIENEMTQSWSSLDQNQWIPYPIQDFSL